ncbi:MAG: hypothetical protein PHE06_16005, partial [Lachnospiraceae bacterium]|nr:hypothetical protein [Lachnospiraceae bacterium]
ASGIAGLEEIDETAGKEQSDDFKMLLAAISSNKTCMKKITLDEIAYLIENLNMILEQEFQEDYPVINLCRLEKCIEKKRRAI